MKPNKTCRVCGVELNDDNWYPSHQKGGRYICKECECEHARLRYKNNPEKAKEINTRCNRKRGNIPMSDNKECSSYLGVHINERLLRHYFNDVEVMPYGNPGYDFICNTGKKIDAKSSCLTKDGRWTFNIKHNKEADFFFCVAYDNRKDLNILHIWLLPGDKFNHFKLVSISPSTIDKWAEYEQDISEVIICCEEIRND